MAAPQARVYNSPERVPSVVGRALFLCGTLEPVGEQWHTKMIQRLQHLPITIFCPYWDSLRENQQSPSQEYAAFCAETQKWELQYLERADVIAFYFAPRSSASISFLELGITMRSQKAIVCCPAEFYRSGTVRILCQRYGVEMVETFEELVQKVAARLTS
ncbi:hypothetical protein C8T65DRAFT_132759 [Cerioporus squamosus]|nr:hypothetical protein C8T65DRAFT_132759 [Cerioporus squamosus]